MWCPTEVLHFTGPSDAPHLLVSVTVYWQEFFCLRWLSMYVLLWTAAAIAITSGRPVDTSDVIVISQPAIGWHPLNTCWQLTVALIDWLLYLQYTTNIMHFPLRLLIYWLCSFHRQLFWENVVLQGRCVCCSYAMLAILT